MCQPSVVAKPVSTSWTAVSLPSCSAPLVAPLQLLPLNAQPLKASVVAWLKKVFGPLQLLNELSASGYLLVSDGADEARRGRNAASQGLACHKVTAKVAWTVLRTSHARGARNAEVEHNAVRRHTPREHCVALLGKHRPRLILAITLHGHTGHPQA